MCGSNRHSSPTYRGRGLLPRNDKYQTGEGENLLDFNSIAEEDRKALTGFAQKLNIKQLELKIINEETVWEKYAEDLPEFSAIRNGFNERHEYFMQNNQAFLDSFYGGKKTPELKKIEKQIRLQQNSLIKKLTQIITESPLVVPRDAQPNLDSPFYEAARDLAERLATLWYIDKVELFGSVARGEETAESDVDLCVNFATKQSSVYLKRWIDKIVAEWNEEYPIVKKPVDILVRSPKMEKLGYFNPCITLKESPDFIFTLMRNNYSVPKTQIVRFSIKGTAEVDLVTCLYQQKTNRYLMITMMDNTPLLLTEIEYKVINGVSDIKIKFLDASEDFYSKDVRYLTFITYDGFISIARAVSQEDIYIWLQWETKMILFHADQGKTDKLELVQ